MGLRYNEDDRLWEYAVERKPGGAFAGIHWRDQRNNLDGIRAIDRLLLLEALRHSVEQASREAAGYDDGKEELVTWFALSVLAHLVRQSRVRWGVGNPGSAKLPGPDGRAARKRRSEQDSWRDQLLLNVIETAKGDPRFCGIDFARETGRLRKRLWKRIASIDAVLPSHALSIDVLCSLHILGGTAFDEATVATWGRRLDSRKPILLNGLDTSFTPGTVAAVLAYYGAGSCLRRNGERCVRVNLPRVVKVLQRSRQPAGLDLRDLPWMDGKYRYATAPASFGSHT